MKSAVLWVLNPCTTERALHPRNCTFRVMPGLYFVHRTNFELYITVLNRSSEVSIRMRYVLF
jgi:hypothetical protein